MFTILFHETSVMCSYLRNLFFCEFQSDTAATAAMEVCSAVSGETLAVLDPDEFEGKSTKYVKQCLSAKIGVTRFWQKLLADGLDGSEIPDGTVFALASVKVQRVILDFWPPDEEQDEKIVSLHRVRTMQLHLKSCCNNHGLPM